MVKPLLPDALWKRIEPLLPKEPPKPQGAGCETGFVISGGGGFCGAISGRFGSTDEPAQPRRGERKQLSQHPGWLQAAGVLENSRAETAKVFCDSLRSLREKIFSEVWPGLDRREAPVMERRQVSGYFTNSATAQHPGWLGAAGVLREP